MAEEKKETGDGEPKAGANLDGHFEITVSPDKLRAELKVIPPKPGGQAVAAEAVMQKVSEMGLKDADRAAVEKFLTDANFVMPMVIAEGKSPVDGQDGHVDYLYLEKGGAKEDKHGNVDTRSRTAFKFAATDEKILKNHPPVEGKDGITVFGDAIAYKPGNNPVPAPGKNIRVSEDGTEYFATESGMVTIAGNVISVDKVLKTEGDVDFKVGNIDFDGAVIITGAILEGFKVRATGDVMAAIVSQGSIESGGNVVIEKGIIGTKDTFVNAKGDITAKFIENANIKSGGSVMVSEAILHSTVSAGKHVLVRGGKHCNIVGGSFQVAGCVEATMIGSEVYTKTVIEVGYDPALRAQLQLLDSELAKQTDNQEKMKNAVATLTKLKAQIGKLPPDKDALLKKMTETSKILDKEVRDFQKERSDLQEKLQHARPGTVSAKDAIMPGTTVTILSETTKISKKYPSTTIYLDREHKKIAFTSFTAVEI